VPGVFDPFEAVVRAVIGQRISVTAARTCLTRFAVALGEPLAAPSHGVERLFPDASRVAREGPEVVARAGLPRQKSEAIVEVARRVERGLLAEPRDRVVSALADVRGIGGFTVGYAAMRGLFDPDGFPSGDLVIARVLGVSPARAEARVEPLRPYRAYAAIHAYTASADERRPS
jgi:AraC family transcriptional regulator of adaptative response / DNA-3-methyladenine glycosylase II